MITNYKNFDYNQDFTPTSLVFNLNSDNRKIGIGVSEPKHDFDVQGNISFTGNLIFKGNFNYHNNINEQNLSLLSVNNKGLLIYKNLVSSTTTGVDWSFSNNNNINFTLKDINDNTDLDYNSDLVLINNNNNIKINISIFNNVTIKYLFISDNNNNLTTNNFDNVLIKCNGIESYIKKISNGLYELTNYINLLNNNQHIINILNLSIQGKIQLWGHYDYQAGSMWNQNSNNDLYINHNIGININNPKSELHINYNSIFNGNIVISNNLITDYLITNTIKTKDLITNNIFSSNKLLINTNKKTVSINSNLNNNILNIGNHFSINDLTIQSNNTIVNNINNSQNTLSIGNKSFYLNINTNQNSLNIQNNLIDNNKNIYFNNSVIIDPTNISDSTNYNTDSSNLYVVGDMYVNGSITSTKFPEEKIKSNKIKVSNLNTNTIKTTQLIVDSYSYVKSIEADKIQVNKLWTVSINNINNHNNIYYDSNTDTFKYSDSTNQYDILTQETQTTTTNNTNNNNNSDLILDCIGLTESNLLNSKSINVDRVNTNQLSFKLNSNIGIVYNVNNLEIELINSNFKTFDLCN